ncbi:pollen receptor-like kinase 4 [Hordeum vulgare]|nr:pollen receptor-like kinase 4 [Hordeum vulgare]
MARLRPPGHLRLAFYVAVVVGVGLCAPAAVLVSAIEGGKTEGEVLVAFRDKLRASDGSPPGPLRSWGTPGPCNGNHSSWYGVSCHGNGSVQGLQLERLGLAGGAPDVGSLAVLPGLRVISLSDNALTGPFPNVSALGVLKMLYLSRNRFSGEIPADTFRPMRGLRKLHLSRNDFSGHVPSSITSPRLLELTLANNRFDGPLPDFSQPELRFVDVSNNNLSGPIPAGLSRFNATMFRGNKFLCGKPTDVVCDTAALSPAGGMSTFTIIVILLIVLGVLLAAAGIAMGVLGRRRRRRRRAKRTDGCVTLPNGEVTPSNPVLETAPAVSISQATVVGPTAASASGGGGPAKRGTRRDEHGRLVFIQESRVRFEIEDLLRASAEVLGSGNFGSSYKATLQEGPEVVVKRFKDMNGVGREDFSEHMRRLGRLAHPNLVPLVAYLYKKEEKLLITDYVVNGSLAQLLHGNRGSMLDWGKRLRIIKGAARGLSHLYDELPMLTVPHGHLKSSNVLLDATFQPALSDYALVPVLTATHAAQVMMAYKAPECVASHGKPTRKSDVWSLGILTLEVLTGKFPACRQGRQGTTDLAGWVNSVITEERTGEVFDKDMSGGKGNEEEMLKLLRVALACCEADIDKRLDLKAALAGIEEIREPEPESSSALTGEGESKS